MPWTISFHLVGVLAAVAAAVVLVAVPDIGIVVELVAYDALLHKSGQQESLQWHPGG
jgi:hypothetical protein